MSCNSKHRQTNMLELFKWKSHLKVPIRIQDLWVKIEQNHYLSPFCCFIGPSIHPRSKPYPIRSTVTSRRRLKKSDWSQEMSRYHRKLLASSWQQRSSGRILTICVYRFITFSEFLMCCCCGIIDSESWLCAVNDKAGVNLYQSSLY